MQIQDQSNNKKTLKELKSLKKQKIYYLRLCQAKGVVVHSSTIRRHLIQQGLRGCIARKKLLFRKGIKQKRSQSAKNHKNWTLEDQSRVLWTDESKSESFASGRRQFVRRRIHEVAQTTNRNNIFVGTRSLMSMFIVQFEIMLRPKVAILI